MRITSWNVNGLRAALNKGVGDWLRSSAADIVCLQEIKVHPHQLTEEQLSWFTGSRVLWNPAVRPGYSGVATILNSPHLDYAMGLGVDRFDAEGRVVQTRQDGFLLFNVYFPNGKRDHTRLSYKLDFYACLLEMCDRLHATGEQIVICGDFNTAHREIDLRNPKQNENTSGFLPEERAWIDLYLEHGFVDAYRWLYPERIQYTWWTYRLRARERNIGWRLDYFLVSESLLPRVEDVTVHEEVWGSDHCPVTLKLRDWNLPRDA
jgi:exodeoxyribonuclease III